MANNDMWRDFIFATGSTSAGEGLDITVTGLLADFEYRVRLWAFDDLSNGGRNMTWNGEPLNLPTSPDPTSLDDQVVSFKALTDANGTLVLEGRVAEPIGTCCNVFVNGFELTPVPEPSSLVLACVGMGLVGLRRIRSGS